MKKPKSTAKTTPKNPAHGTLKSGIGDGLRQAAFPREFRIAAPAAGTDAGPAAETVSPPPAAKPEHDRKRDLKVIAELANTLWYIKAKFFKRKWEDAEASDDDPRVRRALGRINRCTEELRKAGLEVQDPTGKRYPQGGEAMMRPVELLPTDGITVEVVSDTVTPMIFLNEVLFQRAEVFIAVPRQPTAASAESVQPLLEAPPPAGPGEAAAPAPVTATATPAETGLPVPAPEAPATPSAAAAPGSEPDAAPLENNLQPSRNVDSQTE